MADYDVIVVGAGGAGLTAAWHAASAGCSVLIVEASDKVGGATALAGGVVYASGTRVQEAARIKDSPDDMYHYMMTLNQWSLRPEMVRIMAEGGRSMIDWLVELGNTFPPELTVCSGADSVPRGHQAVEAGAGIVASISNAVGALGVEIALGSRVSSLIVEDGRVCGIRAGGEDVRSHAVVLTTGGIGNSPEMIARLYPTAAAHGSRVYSVYKDAPFNVGDGIILGESVGARLTGLDTGLLNPTPNFGQFVEAFLPEWAMVVNRDGRRFIPEDAPYAISGYLINEQPEMRCFAIFDEPAFLEACADENIVKHYLNDPGQESWRIAIIRENVATGRVKTAGSIPELAQRSDISPTALEQTIKRYNTFADKGEDPQFFKKAKKIYPIRTGPYYAVEIRASMIGSCHAGLDIDAQGHVVNETENIIPGLYAAGEILGCTLGRRYIGGGIGIANALTYGKLAGVSAARDILALR
jgi:fumarate reductase flavoprotein subunit